MFSLTGIVITFFLSAIMAGKKDKSESDFILIIWLLVIGIHLSLYYWHTDYQNLKIPWLLGFEIPLPLTHGPFLYLYTASLTKQSPGILTRLLNFTPVT